jgi:hypothetical protein
MAAWQPRMVELGHPSLEQRFQSRRKRIDSYSQLHFTWVKARRRIYPVLDRQSYLSGDEVLITPTKSCVIAR